MGPGVRRDDSANGRPQSDAVQPLGRIRRRRQSLSGEAKACLYPAIRKRVRKRPQRKSKRVRETRHEWECSRGFDKAGLSQDRMAGARYRGRAAVRWRHRFEVADSAEALREAYPVFAGEMGEGATRSYLAGAAHGPRPAMAQALLWRGEAHGGRPDPGHTQSKDRARSSGRDPVGKFDRARADDAGCDAGAVSGSPGIAGLLADEP